MSSFTLNLPDVPEPRFDGDGWVRVGEYLFDLDDLDHALEDEAEYIAACLAAKDFFATHKADPRRQRIERATQIVQRAAAVQGVPEPGKATWAVIAAALLDAIDSGAL